MHEVHNVKKRSRSTFLVARRECATKFCTPGLNNRLFGNLRIHKAVVFNLWVLNHFGRGHECIFTQLHYICFIRVLDGVHARN